MKEKLITLETAKLAKEGGFNEKCDKAFINYYCEHYKGGRKYQIQLFHQNIYNGPNPIYQAPTQSLLQKWIREVHNYHISITYKEVKGSKIEGINSVYFDIEIYYLSDGGAYKKIKVSQYSDNYEKALEKGLKETLKLIT